MEKTEKKRNLFRYFISYYKPYKATFFCDMGASLIFSLSGLFYPILTRQMLNDFIPGGMVKEIILFGVGLIGIYILRACMNYYISCYGHIMGVKMQAQMRSDLFAHLQKLPYSFYDNHETGQIMARMTNDLFTVSELAHHGPENLFISSFMIVGSFVYLCTINWLLSLIVFAFLPVIIIVSVKAQNEMNAAFDKSRQETGNINATLENSISGIRVTKAYANDAYEQQKFEKNNAGYVNWRSKAYRAMGRFSASMSFTTQICNAVVLVAGGLFCVKGKLDYGDLAAFMLSISLFINPVENLLMFSEQLQDGVTGFRRYVEIMDAKIEEDSEAAKDMQKPEGNLRFEHVSFSYDDKKEVLKDINIDIPAGKIYALVGSSGGGKTTLCHLIPKFYKLQNGMIYIDGVPISEISNKSLRQNVGIVQQDVFLFTGTFRENIAYGNENATEEEIITAAKRADIHDYITGLPEGYDTQIGERGIKLSGGQKQRLSIARVFLKDPSILILDEATSALDNATEVTVQKALFELCKGRTTLIVAHRLSTIKSADEIIVIDDGEIKERGTHAQLLSQDGEYKLLYESQYKEYDE